ncbi:hypothetical protein RAM_06040 [Amycolatopsis mediterranei S699]|uniref:Uncharacterized protein n=1 Tax=Amycolatopsis mediterranei (strain S699) TaxID=713604 RepID=A0A9R0NSA9_AMYMS|nr:hypothetical protein RAM_06040 [Amycolatopsis mediterranei S699]
MFIGAGAAAGTWPDGEAAGGAGRPAGLGIGSRVDTSTEVFSGSWTLRPLRSR